MNFKKAEMTLEQILKIVIAILVIFVLITLSVKLYSLTQSKTDIEQARAHLDQISSILGNLKEGEIVDYVLLDPNDWHISVWPAQYQRVQVTPSGGSEGSDYTIYNISGNPEECKKNNWAYCICLCDSQSTRKDILEDCNTLGVCKEVKFSGVKINTKFDSTENEEIYVRSLIRDKKALKLSLNKNILSVSESS